MKKIIIICLSFLLVACATKYEDTNGKDNYNLQTITDENIINLETGASGLSYSQSSIAGITSSKYSSKNFNGVEQIFLIDYLLPSDVEIYIGHMSVESGNFKLAVINNEKIIKEIPIDSFNETFYFEDLTGTFSIHVAGESASFDFHIDIS